MQKSFYIIGLVAVTLLLNACQLFQNTPDSNRKAVCKEMRQQMTFNGDTADRSRAFTEHSEQAKLSQSYHDEGCIN